jgi:hypothetical protein
MTSKRQRLQPFHDVGPIVSSPYNSTIHIYSEGNLGDKNFSLTQATPYNSDHLISDHSLLHTTDDGALLLYKQIAQSRIIVPLHQ